MQQGNTAETTSKVSTFRERLVQTKEEYDDLAGQTQMILNTARQYLKFYGVTITDDEIDLLTREDQEINGIVASFDSQMWSRTDSTESDNNSNDRVLVAQHILFQVDQTTGAIDSFFETCHQYILTLTQNHPQLTGVFLETDDKEYEKAEEYQIAILQAIVCVGENFLNEYETLFPSFPDLASETIDEIQVLDFLSHPNVPENQKIRILQEIIYLRIFQGETDNIGYSIQKKHGQENAARSLPTLYLPSWREGCKFLARVNRAVLDGKILFELPDHKSPIPSTGVTYYHQRFYSKRFENGDAQTKQKLLALIKGELGKVDLAISTIQESITSTQFGQSLIAYDLSHKQSRYHNRLKLAQYFVDYWADDGGTAFGIPGRFIRLSQLIQLKKQYTEFLTENQSVF